jgi:MFS family permease
MQDSAAPSRVRESVRLLASLYLPSMLVAVGQGLVVPTIPTLATAFRVSPALAAQVVTALLLGRALMTIPSGMVIDRLGRRPAMIVGPLMVAAGSAITALTPVFQLLLAGQFLTGAGIALWQLGREVAAVDLMAPHVRGRVLSLFFGLTSAGMALGPLAGGFIAQAWGFRSVFSTEAVLALLVLGLSANLPETGKRHTAAPRPFFDFAKLTDLPGMFRTTYVVLMYATFAAMLRNSVVNAILPLHAEITFGHSATEVGGLFAAIAVLNLLVMGPAGWISDKIGRKAAVIPAAVCSGLAFLAYPYASSLPALFAVSVLVGIAGGFALGSMTVYTYDIAPATARGRLQALRRTMGEIGGVTGPAVAGPIISVSNTGWAFLALAPLHIIAAIALAIGARETAGKRGWMPEPSGG